MWDFTLMSLLYDVYHCTIKRKCEFMYISTNMKVMEYLLLMGVAAVMKSW